jgi:hypothetical protein
MKVSSTLMALAAATLLVTGCAKNREPAKNALDSIEKSLADVRDEAGKYAPDGLKGVEAQLARLKSSYEAKEYEVVTAGGPQLEKAVASLKSAVDASKAQARSALAAAKSEWAALTEEVPKTIDSIQQRVDTLSKQKRLPFGINKEEFEGAKNAFESMKTTWADASAEAKKGDAVEATTKGKTAKGMGESIAEQLKIKQS